MKDTYNVLSSFELTSMLIGLLQYKPDNIDFCGGFYDLKAFHPVYHARLEDYEPVLLYCYIGLAKNFQKGRHIWFNGTIYVLETSCDKRS